MNRLLTFNDIEELYDIKQDRLTLWLAKGYIKESGNKVNADSLEDFLADLGYKAGDPWLMAVNRTGEAFRQFMELWTDVLGDEQSELLKECLASDNLVDVAERHSIALSSLHYLIQTAVIRLKKYFSDVPYLRIRLAELLKENKQLKQKISPEDMHKKEVCDFLLKHFDYDDETVEEAYNNLMKILHTPIQDLGLSVRCSNAAHKSGVRSLMDFIVVNKACGKSGMLNKLQNFGEKSYNEVENLLKNLKLITVDSNGDWISAANVLVDTESVLFLQYSSGRQPAKRSREKENSRVAEWIGSYIAYSHRHSEQTGIV